MLAKFYQFKITRFDCIQKLFDTVVVRIVKKRVSIDGRMGRSSKLIAISCGWSCSSPGISSMSGPFSVVTNAYQNSVDWNFLDVASVN